MADSKFPTLEFVQKTIVFVRNRNICDHHPPKEGRVGLWGRS